MFLILAVLAFAGTGCQDTKIETGTRVVFNNTIEGNFFFQPESKTTYDKVVAELKKLEYTGVTGTITFDANGDPIKPISIVEIKDGKYTLNASM